MMYFIIAAIFMALASICNSVMDTLDHHQSTSIFSKFKNPLWWNSDQGWRNKYIDRDPKKGRVKWFWKINKPVQITDAWHFFKMLMIVFMCGAASISFTKPGYWIIYFIAFGLIWNNTFSLFYKRILIIKKK